MQDKWFLNIENIASQVAEKVGCVLYDIEFTGLGKGRTLRVFIDKVDGGIGIEECTNFSNAFNEIIDTDEKLIPVDSYQLEVSSPGVDRHLSKPWHFEQVVGKKIYVKTHKPLEAAGVEDKKWRNAKTIEEVLAAADGDGLTFKVKELEFKIPYQMIDKAKLVFVMPKGVKK